LFVAIDQMKFELLEQFFQIVIPSLLLLHGAILYFSKYRKNIRRSQFWEYRRIHGCEI